MHLSVEAIQSDAFFVTPADLEAKKEFFPNDDKSKLIAEVSAQENPRLEMLQMGNTLVDLTDQITKQSVKFIKTFNKQFTYVRLDQFIFCEADYI